MELLLNKLLLEPGDEETRGSQKEHRMGFCMRCVASTRGGHIVLNEGSQQRHGRAGQFANAEKGPCDRLLLGRRQGTGGHDEKPLVDRCCNLWEGK